MLLISVCFDSTTGDFKVFFHTVSLEMEILPIKKGTFPAWILKNSLNPLIIPWTKLLINGSSQAAEMPANSAGSNSFPEVPTTFWKQ